MTWQFRVKNGGKQFALCDDDDRVHALRHGWRAERRGYAFYLVARSGKCLPKNHMLFHRLVMKAEPGQLIDHINGNGLDNRKENLRFCTAKENARNTNISYNKFKSSGFKGVCQVDGKWRAGVTANGKHLYLGQFETEADAARAYDESADRLFGEFARTNADLGLY